VRLRDKILRKPLRLEFTEEQLEEESSEFHFGVYDIHDQLLGCLSFKPLVSNTIKMRQVAIDDVFQNSGIGSFLVESAEQWAVNHQYEWIDLHARDTAVSFYTKLNYQLYGEPFIEVNIPHRSMRKKLN
jgi:N-acetylglutamate synthase-like GNAT family acetyltransferase